MGELDFSNLFKITMMVEGFRRSSRQDRRCRGQCRTGHERGMTCHPDSMTHIRSGSVNRVTLQYQSLREWDWSGI